MNYQIRITAFYFENYNTSETASTEPHWKRKGVQEFFVNDISFDRIMYSGDYITQAAKQILDGMAGTFVKYELDKWEPVFTTPRELVSTDEFNRIANELENQFLDSEIDRMEAKK